MARQESENKGKRAVCAECKKDIALSRAKLHKNLYHCADCFNKIETIPSNNDSGEDVEQLKERNIPKRDPSRLEMVNKSKPEGKQEDLLMGMLEIGKYSKRSHSTIFRWVKTHDFPAWKAANSVWFSYKGQIDKWFKDQVKNS